MGIFLSSKYYLGLFLAGVVAVALVWAEERRHLPIAEACLVTILLLFALMIWDWWKANHQPPQLSVEATVYYRATNKVLLCAAMGFAALLLNANRWEHWKFGMVARAIGYGSMVAGAFFIGGVLLGYLFGLRPSGASHGQSFSASQGHASSTTPTPHTNLEEIADWLTKLILGAGLVELTRLKAPIAQLASFMARGVNPPPFLLGVHEKYEDPGSQAIALSIMGFFSASGLLYGYLWTRYQQALKAGPSEDAIRDRARQLYLQRGGKEGHAVEDWLAAEVELLKGQNGS